MSSVDDSNAVPGFGVVITSFGGFITVTDTVDVAMLPVASRATALSVCDPFDVVLLSQGSVYGSTVSSGASAVPSSLNVTPATTRSSDAVRSEERRVGKEC